MRVVMSESFQTQKEDNSPESPQAEDIEFEIEKEPMERKNYGSMSMEDQQRLAEIEAKIKNENVEPLDQIIEDRLLEAIAGFDFDELPVDFEAGGDDSDGYYTGSDDEDDQEHLQIKLENQGDAGMKIKLEDDLDIEMDIDEGA